MEEKRRIGEKNKKDEKDENEGRNLLVRRNSRR